MNSNSIIIGPLPHIPDPLFAFRFYKKILFDAPVKIAKETCKACRGEESPAEAAKELGKSFCTGAKELFSPQPDYYRRCSKLDELEKKMKEREK